MPSCWKPRARGRGDGRGRTLPLSLLRAGHYGTHVLRPRLRAVPLGLHLGGPEDLETTDSLAAEVLEEIRKTAPDDIRGQLDDNIHWIREAGRNRLVVGSQARILYAAAKGA